MEEVYALLVKVEHLRHKYRRSDMLRAICKTKEAVIRIANNEIKDYKKKFSLWKTSSTTTFDDREVTEDDMFVWEDFLEVTAREHTFYREYDDDGYETHKWHLYVMKMPLEE